MWTKATDKIWFWLKCTLLVACCFVAAAIVESLTAFDRSAMAWVTFLPFVFPIFIIQALIYVVPVACVCELIMWMKANSP